MSRYKMSVIVDIETDDIDVAMETFEVALDEHLPDYGFSNTLVVMASPYE